MPAKITHKEFLDKIKPDIQVLGRYLNSRTRIKVKCLNCGNIWHPVAHYLYYNGCPMCARKVIEASRRYTGTIYKEQVSKIHGNSIRVLNSEEYRNQRTKLKHICSICNYVWLTSAVSTICNKYGCPSCSNSKTRMNIVKKYRLGERTVLLEGYEHYGLDWILTNTNIHPNDILVSKCEDIPLFYYRKRRVDGHRSWYKPDFYIPNKSIFVEVKSLATAGLVKHTPFSGSPTTLWGNLIKKRNLVAENYTFKLLVFSSKGERIMLPKDWWVYTHREMINFLEVN